MANDAAWQAGVDIAAGMKNKKKAQPTDEQKTANPEKRKAKSGKASGGGGSSGVYSGFSGMGILPILSKIMGSKKKGGPIKKTGVYLLHKNEYVVPAKHRSAPKRMRKRTVIKH